MEFIAGVLAFIVEPAVSLGILLGLSFLAVTTVGSSENRDRYSTGFSGFSTLCSILIFAFLLYINKAFAAVLTHWPQTLMYIAIYLAVGVAWSFYKWLRFLSKTQELFLKRKGEFCSNKDIDASQLETDPQWGVPFHTFIFDCHWLHTFLVFPSNNRNYRTAVRSITPQASQCKTMIIEWIALWPQLVLSFMFSDFLSTVFNGIFNVFRSSFQRLSDNKFASL